jgi:hypothetical protein
MSDVIIANNEIVAVLSTDAMHGGALVISNLPFSHLTDNIDDEHKASEATRSTINDIDKNAAIIIRRSSIANNTMFFPNDPQSLGAPYVGGVGMSIIDEALDKIIITDTIYTNNSLTVDPLLSRLLLGRTFASALSMMLPWSHGSVLYSNVTNGVAGNIVIERCSFTMNTMMGGINASGALFIHSGESLSIHDSHFSDNHIDVMGPLPMAFGAGAAIICLYHMIQFSLSSPTSSQSQTR